MKVATTQFSLEPVNNEDQFWSRIETLISEASSKGAKVILLPEYFSLSWILFKIGATTFKQNLARCNEVLIDFERKFQSFSNQYTISVISGTTPISKDNKISNRSFIFQPHLKPIFQDKVHMTRFENEEWNISGGPEDLTVFQIENFNCAVTTCYDVEFPSVTAIAAKKQVDILFVPSCTDDIHGYWRVRHCAQARTIENQCFALMSSIVSGDPRWSEIDSHFGQSGIFTPCDKGFPEAGIQLLGTLNKEGVIVSELNKESLEIIRKNGTVLNLRDLNK